MRANANHQSRPAGAFGLRIAVALLACLAACALPAAEEARASKFVYMACDPALPGGNPPVAEYHVNAGVPLIPFQTCAQPGGAIGITETGPAASTYGYWNVEIPTTPGGYIESIALSAVAAGLGPGNDRTFVYEQGWPPNNGIESLRIIRVDSSPPAFAWPRGFTIFMNCNGNYAAGCGAGPVVAARNIAATEVDVTSPTLGPPRGSLLGEGVLRGRQSLEVEAADVGGGLSEVTVSVNGLPTGQPETGDCALFPVRNRSYEGKVAVSATPCPSKLQGSWVLDTAAPPFRRGANAVQLCASDYASASEPNETCSAPISVAVDNSCAESVVAGGEVLSARFAATHASQVTVPYAHTAKVTGELASNAGDVISGATICVQMQTQGTRGAPRPVTTLTTDARGHFSYQVPPGPNRKVLVGYRHDTFQVARSVRYYAHAKPTIAITPSVAGLGGEVRIRGRLPGARSGGRVVVLQASALHSDRWYTFRRATTDAGGIFRGRYRFDETTQATIYRIRAVVPRQRDWPWEIGHSVPALVRVGG